MAAINQSAHGAERIAVKTPKLGLATKNPNPKKTPNHGEFEEEVDKQARKSMILKKFALLQINTDKIFEVIFDDARRDQTIFATISAIINLCRKEL